LLGDNGVITRAQNASDETKKTSVIEDVELAWSGRTSAYYDAYANNSSVNKNDYFEEEDINKELSNGTIVEDSYNYNLNGETTFTYEMNATGEKYGIKVTEIGNVSITSYNGVSLEPKILGDENFAFPQIISKDGKIYYFKDEEAAGEEITSNNVGKYLGMKVSANSYNANNATYRLFYIDFAGDYGIENTIYLKANWVENTTLTTETYNPDNVQKFNRGYTTTNTSQARNTGVSWLLNSENWKKYCDTTKGATAAYGAPSLEMWVRSYNKFLNAHSGLYNANSEVAKTLAYNFDTSGYYVGVKEGVDETGIDTSITSTYSGSKSLILASNNSEETSQVQAQIGMYNPGLWYYWLASPSADYSGGVVYVNGDR
jgi:hypothetical protein